jgi:hypothetical protein
MYLDNTNKYTTRPTNRVGKVKLTIIMALV